MSKRGFGTNFHEIYGSDPKIYHRFSSAERFSKTLESRVRTLLQPGKLLDVAAGTCHKSDFFSKDCTEVYALDKSKILLEFGRRKYARNPKLHFLWSSATAIPLLDESMDSVLVTWGSFPLKQSLREMKRVLKRGGTIVRIGAIEEDEFTTLFPAFDTKRVDRINSTFRSHGFEIERHKVTIRFKDVNDAKEVLGRITGASTSRITQAAYIHRVALCYYKKQ